MFFKCKFYSNFSVKWAWERPLDVWKEAGWVVQPPYRASPSSVCPSVLPALLMYLSGSLETSAVGSQSSLPSWSPQSRRETGGWAGSHHSSLSKFKAEVEALRDALGGWVSAREVREQCRSEDHGAWCQHGASTSQARTDCSFCGMVGNTPWQHWFEGCDPKTPPAL